MKIFARHRLGSAVSATAALAIGASLLVATALAEPPAKTGPLALTRQAACAPSSVILATSVGQGETQAKALNDRGDVVGFSDVATKGKAIHAVLWKNGKAGDASRSWPAPGLRLLRGLRREQQPRGLRGVVRQAGANVPVPLGSGPHDRC